MAKLRKSLDENTKRQSFKCTPTPRHGTR
uniref:Uncharacterized protein n=1 Tax=Arundo donax TaxID=35708 RepID=A0A0A9FT10_ARUDO